MLINFSKSANKSLKYKKAKREILSLSLKAAKIFELKIIKKYEKKLNKRFKQILDIELDNIELDNKRNNLLNHIMHRLDILEEEMNTRLISSSISECSIN